MSLRPKDTIYISEDMGEQHGSFSAHVQVLLSGEIVWSRAISNMLLA